MVRAIAAGAAFVAAAVIGVITVLVAARPSLGLWVALGAVVVVGGVLQGAVSAADRRSGRRVRASGDGAVAIGGNAGEVRTKVRGPGRATPPSAKMAGDEEDVAAPGRGAVGIGGNADGLIATDVSDTESGADP
jgi:hypothetical protein